MYYEKSKPVIVQMNSSKYGLGVALIQSSCPIAFASKTLTDVETHYANIERGCLSVCFSLEKFHTHLYDSHVIVQNDHKPLEMIQQKPIHATPTIFNACSSTCKNMTSTIQYKPGKQMVLADHLSHFPSHKESLPIPIAQNIQHV